MPVGKVKWYNPTKGFGFISVDGSNDVFLHRNALVKSGVKVDPDEDDIVEFEVEQSPKGLRAINIRMSTA